MKVVHFAVVVLASALCLGGCASQQAKLAKDQAKAEKIEAKASERRAKVAQKEAKSEMKAYPKWAMNPPKVDESGMYAVGMADSDKLPVALKKAQLEANFQLAKLYNQELSGGERAQTRDNGSATMAAYSNLIESLVDWVPVAGFQVQKQEVVPIDGRFHAFVLIKLPFEEFNAVLQERKRKAMDASESAAFEDLAQRLERFRDAKVAIARAANGITASDAPAQASSTPAPRPSAEAAAE